MTQKNMLSCSVIVGPILNMVCWIQVSHAWQAMHTSYIICSQQCSKKIKFKNWWKTVLRSARTWKRVDWTNNWANRWKFSRQLVGIVFFIMIDAIIQMYKEIYEILHAKQRALNEMRLKQHQQPDNSLTEMLTSLDVTELVKLREFHKPSKVE